MAQWYVGTEVRNDKMSKKLNFAIKSEKKKNIWRENDILIVFLDLVYYSSKHF